MMTPHHAIRQAVLGTASLCLLVSCAQPRPYGELWVTPRPLQERLESLRPETLDRDITDGVVLRRDEKNPDGEISMHDAVRLALSQNHGLAASGWASAAAEADAMQMGRPRNPTAGFAVENFGGPDAGETFQRQTLKLSQVIELAGKREKRLALGQAEQSLRAWDYEQARIDVASETAKRFVAVVVAQRRVALSEQQLKLAESAQQIASERFDNGTAPGFEVDRAAVRVSLGKVALQDAQQTLEADRADLAAMWGGNSARFTAVAGDLDQRTEVPPLEDLKQWARQSPPVARWADEIRQRQAVVELEKAKATTDPSVGAGVRYFSDAEEFAGLVDLSWPLAVWDDNRSAVLSARLKLGRARSMQEQAVAETDAALARAYARFQAAAYSAQALDQDALTSARAAYQAALDAYKAGLTDYLNVLDAERSLLEIRFQQLETLYAYHTSLILIEGITAHPIQAELP